MYLTTEQGGVCWKLTVHYPYFLLDCFPVFFGNPIEQQSVFKQQSIYIYNNVPRKLIEKHEYIT